MGWADVHRMQVCPETGLGLLPRGDFWRRQEDHSFYDEAGGNGNGVGWRFSQTVFCMPGTVPGEFTHQHVY